VAFPTLAGLEGFYTAGAKDSYCLGDARIKGGIKGFWFHSS